MLPFEVDPLGVTLPVPAMLQDFQKSSLEITFGAHLEPVSIVLLACSLCFSQEVVAHLTLHAWLSVVWAICTHHIPFKERTLSPGQGFLLCAVGWEGGFYRASLKEFAATLKGAGLGWLSSGMLVH